MPLPPCTADTDAVLVCPAGVPDRDGPEVDAEPTLDAIDLGKVLLLEEPIVLRRDTFVSLWPLEEERT